MQKATWFVWSETGHIPTFKHESEEGARTEAARLARNNPGTVFHVLMSIASCRKSDVYWTQHSQEDLDGTVRAEDGSFPIPF